MTPPQSEAEKAFEEWYKSLTTPGDLPTCYHQTDEPDHQFCHWKCESLAAFLAGVRWIADAWDGVRAEEARARSRAERDAEMLYLGEVAAAIRGRK